MSIEREKARSVPNEQEQAQNFRIKFLGKPHSWVETSMKRLGDILQETPEMWRVRGRNEFNDYQNVYLVTFNPKEQKYKCTCFSTRYGHVREKEICTHIGSVIFWRMMNKAIEAKGNEVGKRNNPKPILLFGNWKALERACSMAEPPILLITNFQIPITSSGIVLRLEPDIYQFDIDDIGKIVSDKGIRTVIHYFNPSGTRDVLDILSRQVSELHGLASASEVKLIYVTTISSKIEEYEWKDLPSNMQAYKNVISDIRYVDH